jgi:uncharacterized protein YegJ (DUF2314 family)
MVPVFLCAVLLLSCQKPSAPAAFQEPVRIMQVDHADEEILQIAEDARNTLPNFFRHLNRAGIGEKNFCIKYPFETDNGTEQVWISGISFKEGMYHGVLVSSPRQLNGMKRGDTVSFDADSITDWMYVRGDKIIGGYSIKYLLEKIPENQRSEGEQELLQMFY